jgi:hypothetical protein
MQIRTVPVAFSMHGDCPYKKGIDDKNFPVNGARMDRKTAADLRSLRWSIFSVRRVGAACR